MTSTALLKMRPDNGKPYWLPSTCKTIPGGTMKPSGVVLHGETSFIILHIITVRDPEEISIKVNAHS